ncbi:MAG: NAD(P)/FAD-dependent oxidoreductase [Thiohalobacterales bacterium]|nr:NAD(P)/FAD-dependent oxidoreductase [Thiohalobacterales bacterium]
MPPADTGATVLILGGGAAGLSTAGALAERGIAATVIEQDDHIGGSWSRRYRHLRLHTTRRYSGLAHYPIPPDRPRYLTRDDYAAYLREYARALKVDIAFGERVLAVRRITDTVEGTGWEVETSKAVRRAPVVVIATGLYAKPYVPHFEGIDRFAGDLRHSSDYDTPAEFAGRKVLVIGLGNSGAEIAADLATHGAAAVSVSVRTPPPIVSRELLGIVPVQLLGIALTPLGAPGLLDRIGAAMRRVSIGNLAPYGLAEAAWGPFSAHRPAVIDTGFVSQLKQGHIRVRPDVAHFESNEVVFIDGSRDAVDTVIAATGFRTGLEKIIQVPGLIDAQGNLRPPSPGGPTPAQGLYFVGFTETVRGQLFEINRESRQVAAEIESRINKSNENKPGSDPGFP